MVTLTFSPSSVQPAFDDIGDIRKHIDLYPTCAVFVGGICLNIGNVPVERVKTIKEQLS